MTNKHYLLFTETVFVGYSVFPNFQIEYLHLTNAYMICSKIEKNKNSMIHISRVYDRLTIPISILVILFTQPKSALRSAQSSPQPLFNKALSMKSHRNRSRFRIVPKQTVC